MSRSRTLPAITVSASPGTSSASTFRPASCSCASAQRKFFCARRCWRAGHEQQDGQVAKQGARRHHVDAAARHGTAIEGKHDPLGLLEKPSVTVRMGRCRARTTRSTLRPRSRCVVSAERRGGPGRSGARLLPVRAASPRVRRSAGGYPPRRRRRPPRAHAGGSGRPPRIARRAHALLVLGRACPGASPAHRNRWPRCGPRRRARCIAWRSMICRNSSGACDAPRRPGRVSAT
jgi:hypothetical protein